MRFINSVLLFGSYAIPKFNFFNIKLKNVQILTMDRSVTINLYRFISLIRKTCACETVEKAN